MAVVRPGLWCDRCMMSTRVEQDMFDGAELVATLQGCTNCRTGLYATGEAQSGQ